MIATAFVLIHNVPLQASDFGRSTYSDDNECPYQAEENPQQAQEYFKNNTRFLSPADLDRGVCLGLACAWLQSVVSPPDTRYRLRQQLQTCSQNPQQGWHDQNQHYDSLQETFQAAQNRYDAYRAANALPDHPATLENFEKQDAESARQLETKVWIEWLYREQQRQQGCSAQVTTRDKTVPRLSMTHAWPMVTTRASTVQLLRTLRDQPIPAHYLLTTGKHALALSIEKDRLTLFDQNAPCYISYLFITNPKLDLSFSAMSQGYVAITS